MMLMGPEGEVGGDDTTEQGSEEEGGDISEEEGETGWELVRGKSNGAGGLRDGGTGTDGVPVPESRGKGSDCDPSEEKPGRPQGSEHVEPVNGGGRGSVEAEQEGTGQETPGRGCRVADSGDAECGGRRHSEAGRCQQNDTSVNKSG